MHIRTFRAANLQAALAEIRRQMGPTASVLHTRQVRDGWLGWLGRTHVEVTAGMSDELPANEMPVSTSASPTDPMAPEPTGIDARDPSSDVQIRLRTDSSDDLPASLEVYRSELLQLGVPHSIAARWISSTASFQATLGDHASPLTWAEPLQQTVARNIKIAGPIRTRPGHRHVVALVGPTGVGKTTTIAKLAAGFRIEARRQVGLLTIDTYRIAAVQQLKAYSQIMDLPMEVVEDPGDMQAALERLGDVDLVLIDTAGRSPRSDARIEQLVSYLDAAKPDEIHLVLSATSGLDSILTTLDGFSPARPDAMILTKMDETPHSATVLAALEQSVASDRGNGRSLPLSYVTHGQQVPDDIGIADADALAQQMFPSAVSRQHLEAA
ncbi:Flagellar biosynthesis protein FlhF [Crateriforma conspicua]|uniref:Flagellar biosynthesis protein FlhF n=1 Tax=Crateriforma conspicua TaxID=2527996 RepID=A0A5C6FUN4_9PLAN|nr:MULTISPECIES: flagellar biosynthesis protein FlhF [Crateriforma]TWU65198.1 Flagellar biosynthesis protein FlhF [Crateriforma conspicua]